MSELFRAVLPYPPSVNHYWHRSGNRTYISEAGQRFLEQVRLVALERKVQPISDPVTLEAVLHPPDARKRDTDNTLKAVLDSLQKSGVLKDDNLVRRVNVEMSTPVKGGTCSVVLRPYVPGMAYWMDVLSGLAIEFNQPATVGGWTSYSIEGGCEVEEIPEHWSGRDDQVKAWRSAIAAAKHLKG